MRAFAVPAPDPLLVEFQAYAQTAMDDWRVPGMAVAVVRDGTMRVEADQSSMVIRLRQGGGFAFAARRVAGHTFMASWPDISPDNPYFTMDFSMNKEGLVHNATIPFLDDGGIGTFTRR
jgi:hypothetical protein